VAAKAREAGAAEVHVVIADMSQRSDAENVAAVAGAAFGGKLDTLILNHAMIDDTLIAGEKTAPIAVCRISRRRAAVCVLDYFAREIGAACRSIPAAAAGGHIAGSQLGSHGASPAEPLQAAHLLIWLCRHPVNTPPRTHATCRACCRVQLDG
jgi:hypothetical protein